jgi:hypothetical protein
MRFVKTVERIGETIWRAGRRRTDSKSGRACPPRISNCLPTARWWAVLSAGLVTAAEAAVGCPSSRAHQDPAVPVVAVVAVARW